MYYFLTSLTLAPNTIDNLGLRSWVRLMEICHEVVNSSAPCGRESFYPLLQEFRSKKNTWRVWKADDNEIIELFDESGLYVYNLMTTMLAGSSYYHRILINLQVLPFLDGTHLVSKAVWVPLTKMFDVPLYHWQVYMTLVRLFLSYSLLLAMAIFRTCLKYILNTAKEVKNVS